MTLRKIALAMVWTEWIREKKDRGREICHRQRAEISVEAAGRKRGKGFNRLWVTDEMLQGRNGWQTERRTVRNRKVGWSWEMDLE